MADRRSSSRRPNAVVASAALLKAGKIDRLPQPEQWAQEAWAFYDAVGEVRQAVGHGLANAMSRCRLVAARRGRGGDEPRPIVPPDEDDPDAEPLTAQEATVADLIERLAGGTQGQSQLLSDFTVPLSVPGVAYLVGEPDEVPDEEADPPARLAPDAQAEGPETWQVLSADEVGLTQGTYPSSVPGGKPEKRFTVREGPTPADVRVLPEDAVVCKVWRQHKRWHYLPDSPMRAVLGPLRRLDLYGQHLEASGVSRLAGNGILVLPKEMQFATSEKNKNEADPFMADFMDAMLTPIANRNNASAVVPLVVRVKGDLIKDIRHITFATPFAEAIDALIDKELRRFATGMDLPAEIILGLGAANHWGAWQIEESAIKLHIEPMLEAICAGLTTGYLRPALEAAQVDDPDEFIVWYDASELTVRPDRSGDATAAYDRIELSGAAFRREIGMAEDDAPSPEERLARLLAEVLKSLPSSAPNILKALGFTVDLGVMPDDPAQPEIGPPPDDRPVDGPPDTRDNPPPPPDADAQALAASAAEAATDAALLAAADVLVVRAVERAGIRLMRTAQRAGVDHKGPAGLIHTALPETMRLSCLTDGGLLDGAWDLVPGIAARYGVDPLPMVETLDGYVRGLIASGWPHEYARLAALLGG